MRRNLVFVLILSGVVTVALIAFWQKARPSKSLQPPPRESRLQNREQVMVSSPSQRFDWRQVESPDYRTYIRNLRAFGCPEQTIRDIIVADVNALFDSKKRSNFVLTNRFEFWKTGADQVAWVKEQLIEKHNELESAKKAILKELLGEDVTIDSHPPTITELDVKSNLLDFVSPEERSKAISAIQELDHIFDTEFRPLLAADQFDNQAREEYAKYCRDKEARLLETFGPEGKEDYELRTSLLAGFLRHRFRGIEFSEDEFRNLFRFAKQFEMDLDPFYINNNDAKQRGSHEAGALAVWNKARELIGDRRFEKKASPAGRAPFGL